MAPPAPLSLKVDRSAKTLRELALETMRTAIINGHFQAGERLVERTLCEKLDVSRFSTYTGTPTKSCPCALTMRALVKSPTL